MPALKPTKTTAQIVWLGRVPHRDAAEIASETLTEMPLTFAGLAGEFHAGLTRPSCSRVLAQYPCDTEIRNTRQLSIVSAEELQAIAAELGMANIDPAWVGASIVLRGIPDFSHVPPSSRLQSQDGVTLTVDMQNRPCKFPALTMVKAGQKRGKDFKDAGRGRRGVTAWVEREGTLRIGDTLTLHVPDQRAWLAQPDLFSE